MKLTICKYHAIWTYLHHFGEWDEHRHCLECKRIIENPLVT